MFQIKSTKWITLTFVFFVTFFTGVAAKPTFDIYNDDYYSDYATRRSGEQSDHILSSLKRGYYYIDNGSIIPVRRSDDPNTGYVHYSYTPIAHYRKQRSEHKKLFVPNFFG